MKATIELLAQRTDTKSKLAITNAIIAMDSELDVSMLISIITGSYSDRENVVELLFHTGKKPIELVPILVEFLQEDNDRLKVSTYIALGKTKTPEAAKILLKALKKEKIPKMRRVLINAVGNIKTKETIKSLIKIGKNEKEIFNIMLLATEKLGELQAEEAISFLIKRLNEKYYFDFRKTAALALVKIGKDDFNAFKLVEEFIEEYKHSKYNMYEVEQYFKEMKKGDDKEI